MHFKLGLFSLFSFVFLGLSPAQAQDYDDIPPPPIMEDMEDDIIEEVPPDEYIDGPVYEAPEDGASNLPIPAGGSENPPPSSSGFSGSNSSRSSSMPPRSSSRFGRSTLNRADNPGFAPSEGKVHFEIVEGEFWEKGKKRGRKERGN